MPFIGANDRGVAPRDDLLENPARWTGLGKRPGALPLRIVIQIRKIALVSAYWQENGEFPSLPAQAARELVGGIERQSQFLDGAMVLHEMGRAENETAVSEHAKDSLDF